VLWTTPVNTRWSNFDIIIIVIIFLKIFCYYYYYYNYHHHHHHHHSQGSTPKNCYWVSRNAWIVMTKGEYTWSWQSHWQSINRTAGIVMLWYSFIHSLTHSLTHSRSRQNHAIRILPRTVPRRRRQAGVIRPLAADWQLHGTIAAANDGSGTSKAWIYGDASDQGRGVAVTGTEESLQGRKWLQNGISTHRHRLALCRRHNPACRTSDKADDDSFDRS